MNRLPLIISALLLLTTFGAADQHQAENVDRVMLASDENFPDALIAAGPAEKLGIPVLITEDDELPSETQEALDDLAPSKIDIVGGPAVVSEDLENKLEQDYNVSRHWGMTQVGTAAELADAFWPTGAEEAVIVQYPQDGDAYWDDGYKLLTAIRGIVGERPVLLSQEGTLSSATMEAVADLEVSTATVYSTDAVNVTTDLNDSGVENVELEEDSLNGLLDNIETERSTSETDQGRPLVAVAADSYRDALSVSSSPNAASYLVSGETEIENLITRVTEDEIPRVIVTGQPDLAATIADRLRNETDTTVKETSGNAAAAAASNVRDSKAEWAQEQQEKTSQWREQALSSSGLAEKVQELLNTTETELNEANETGDLQEELDEAWEDYDEGEYLDARETASEVRSELRERQYEQAKGNNAAVRELVQTERESFNELAEESRELTRDFRADLKEAESPEERAEIIKEFKEERREMINEYRGSIDDGFEDIPGNRPGESGDEDESDDDADFQTEWGDGELEIEAEDGMITAEGEARVNTGGYTVETETSQSEGVVSFTFDLLAPDQPATQALDTVEFDDSISVGAGDYVVKATVAINGDPIYVTNETVSMSTEDEETENETEDEPDQEISIEGGANSDGYYFDPDVINVTAGETVEFTLENAGGQHDLRIPTFQVGTDIISGGQTASFTYEFEEQGTYEFICSVGNHAELGMTGTINVMPEEDNDQEDEETENETEDAGSADVWLEPQQTVETGQNTTVDLMADGESTIGAYEATIEIENEAVASFLDTTFRNDPGLSNVSYSDDMAEAELEVAMMNETGETRLASLMIEGEEVGETDLDLDASVGTVEGIEYDVEEQGTIVTVESSGDETASISLEDGTTSVPEATTLALTAEGDNIAGYSANITYDQSNLEFSVNGSSSFGAPTTNYGDGWVMFTQAKAQGTTDPTLANVMVQPFNQTGEYPLSFVEADTSLNTETANVTIESYDDGSLTAQ